ncbi:MAG: hypothetical protein ACREPE_10025, partial [Lysobacter sp.]
MGIQYENLDETTRSFMGAEVRSGGHYLSPRLTPEGQMAWPRLMEDAARSHNDDWLAEQLLSMRYVRSEEPYVRNGVTRLRQINRAHAAQQLGEGEFNRYYIRG